MFLAGFFGLQFLPSSLIFLSFFLFFYFFFFFIFFVSLFFFLSFLSRPLSVSFFHLFPVDA